MTGQGTVIVAGLAAGGLHLSWRVVEDEADEVGNMRIVVGTFILVALLLLIGEFWPEGARGLAIVILVTSIVMNGGPFFKMIGSLVESE